jgi:hypothetical protein
MTEAVLRTLPTNKELTLIFKDNCAEIYHIEDGNIIYLVMKGLTKNQCYQANAEKALTALTLFHSSRMLINFRDLVMFSPQDQRWTEEVWQKQASKAGLQQLAMIIPDSLFAVLSINKLTDSIKKSASFDNEHFVDEDEAYGWLMD